MKNDFSYDILSKFTLIKLKSCQSNLIIACSNTAIYSFFEYKIRAKELNISLKLKMPRKLTGHSQEESVGLSKTTQRDVNQLENGNKRILALICINLFTNVLLSTPKFPNVNVCLSKGNCVNKNEQ